MSNELYSDIVTPNTSSSRTLQVGDLKSAIFVPKLCIARWAALASDDNVNGFRLGLNACDGDVREWKPVVVGS